MFMGKLAHLHIYHLADMYVEVREKFRVRQQAQSACSTPVAVGLRGLAQRPKSGMNSLSSPGFEHSQYGAVTPYPKDAPLQTCGEISNTDLSITC